MKRIVKIAINVFITLAIVGIVLFAFIHFIFYLIAQQDAAIVRNRGTAEAKVIGTSYYKGYMVDVVYYVNGVAYENRFGVSSRGYIGEFYKVEYDTTKPNRALLISPEIFFKPQQKTAFTSGVALRVVTSGGRYPDVRYSYTVNKEEYERKQNFYDVSVFKEGGIYPVEYLLDDPRKGILRLPQ
jgi:hypothetical protein